MYLPLNSKAVFKQQSGGSIREAEQSPGAVDSSHVVLQYWQPCFVWFLTYVDSVSKHLLAKASYVKVYSLSSTQLFRNYHQPIAHVKTQLLPCKIVVSQLSQTLTDLVRVRHRCFLVLSQDQIIQGKSSVPLIIF